MGWARADREQREEQETEVRRTRAPEPVARRSLVVGRTDDPAEREADAIAAIVARRARLDPSDADVWSTDVESRIRRSTASPLSASAGPDGGPVDAGTASRIRASRGVPIARDVRRDMESAFGTDFGHVRIHTGARADQLSSELGARAFTLGSDVFFRGGEYQPRSGSGREVLAHELTHTIQQGADGSVQRIQRVRDPLTTQQILDALKGIGFLKGKLKTDLHGSSMEVRVAEMLRSWKEHVAKKSDPDVDLRDAMMLSMALEGVARVICEELNDVSVLPVVSAKLFELYRTEVGSKVKGKQRKLSGAKRTKVLGLTEALMGDDPVTRFMHREISKANAAASIRAMAAKAQQTDPNMTDLAMFGLMEQKFQVKMASYHQGQLHQDDVTERFSARESPGEYSEYFFKKMFGDNALGAGGSLQWNAGGVNAADRLAFSQEAEAKLAELRQAVQAPGQQAAPQPRAGVTAGQERHLSGLEAAEQQIDRANIKTQFVTLFQSRYFLTAGAADALYTNVVNHLGAAPLTITVRAQDWFGKAQAPNPAFAPSAGKVKQTPVATAFGKAAATGDIRHLPTWDDSNLPAEQQRGAKYLRFRAWKDELMSGLNQLSSAEMAVFGALNVNWATSMGGDTMQKHGENYYGDLHFVLDRARVRDRMIYTATDHGQHRRDPLLALHDFTFGDRGVTWLQNTKKLGMLDNIVNDVTARKPIYGLPLLFEVQIFGGVNVLDDVTDVYLGSQVSATLENAVRQFYNGRAVNVVKAGATPQGAVQASGPDVDEMMMSELVSSTFLDAGEKASIDADVTAAQTLTPQQAALMRSVLTVAEYVRKTATLNAGALTGGDLTTLSACVAKLKGITGFLCSCQQATQADKTALNTRVGAAERAVQQAQQAAQNPVVQNPPPQIAAPQNAAPQAQGQGQGGQGQGQGRQFERRVHKHRKNRTGQAAVQ